MAPRRVLTRTREGAFSGLVTAAYLVGYVVVVLTEEHRIATTPDRVAAVGSVVVLGLLWLTLLGRIATLTWGLLRGREPLVAAAGLLWLASLGVALVSWGSAPAWSATGPPPARTAPAPESTHRLAAPSLPGPQTPSSPTTPGGRGGLDDRSDDGVTDQGAAPALSRHAPHEPERSPGPYGAVSLAGSLPLALVAKRQRDRLAQGRLELPESEVDTAIAELRGFDDHQLRILAQRIGTTPSGIVVVTADATEENVESPDVPPTVAVVVAADAAQTVVAFAQAGHALPIGLAGASRLATTATVLNAPGQCRVVTTPDEALRALALRTSFDDVVIYCGPAEDLEPAVAFRCVTLVDAPTLAARTEVSPSRWSVAPPLPDARDAAARSTDAATRVHLLRAEPAVTGLVEPFAATLRRRCLEMTAYLAIHAGEPVTGDRLRVRVLGHGDGDDASSRTLANTASAVRRSLGSDDRGPRLHPVTAAGLYQLHGVSCDLTEFHALCASAREPATADPAAALTRALELVRGEPLATALRGFEWFLAEGYLARLQRDGEWAALQLATLARDAGEFDLAFWAIERGRLIDPYSDALEAALHRVPRVAAPAPVGARVE